MLRIERITTEEHRLASPVEEENSVGARKINENINKIELFDDLPGAIYNYHRRVLFLDISIHPWISVFVAAGGRGGGGLMRRIPILL